MAFDENFGPVDVFLRVNNFDLKDDFLGAD